MCERVNLKNQSERLQDVIVPYLQYGCRLQPENEDAAREVKTFDVRRKNMRCFNPTIAGARFLLVGAFILAMRLSFMRLQQAGRHHAVCRSLVSVSDPSRPSPIDLKLNLRLRINN